MLSSPCAPSVSGRKLTDYLDEFWCSQNGGLADRRDLYDLRDLAGGALLPAAVNVEALFSRRRPPSGLGGGHVHVCHDHFELGFSRVAREGVPE